MPSSLRFAAVFSSKNFIVWPFTFRFLILFDLLCVCVCVCVCMCCKVGIQLHPFVCGYPLVPALFVEKTILSPLTCFISGLLNFIPQIYCLLHTFSNFCLECLICHLHLANFYSKPKACFFSADLVHNTAYLEHSAHRIFVIVCVCVCIYIYL